MPISSMAGGAWSASAVTPCSPVQESASGRTPPPPPLGRSPSPIPLSLHGGGSVGAAAFLPCASARGRGTGRSPAEGACRDGSSYVGRRAGLKPAHTGHLLSDM